MNHSLPLQFDVSLRARNTFGVEARANAYLPVSSVAMLRTVRDDAGLAAMPRFVLGGGSNLLLTRDLDALVLHMVNRGIAVIGEDPDHVFVCAQAGESWHALVQWTLAQGLGGLENLSLIPGSVGAAPIQNIGAYGGELADCFHALQAFDFDSGQVLTLTREACTFAYRDSIFKQELRDRVAIINITVALPKRWQANLRYVELADALAPISNPSAIDISEAVMAIRRRKLPDPAVIGNAGSFFKNPVVSAAQRDALLLAYPQLVSYEQANGSVKLAAGWLIDHCGWKGRSLGAAGVHDRQALVLVNRGGATGEEMVQLGERIQTDVALRFGVNLEIEPVVV